MKENESVYRKFSEDMNSVAVNLTESLVLTHKLMKQALELLDLSDSVNSQCVQNMIDLQEQAQGLESNLCHVIRFYKPKDSVALTADVCKTLISDGKAALEKLLRIAKLVRTLVCKKVADDADDIN